MQIQYQISYIKREWIKHSNQKADVFYWIDKCKMQLFAIYNRCEML